MGERYIFDGRYHTKADGTILDVDEVTNELNYLIDRAEAAEREADEAHLERVAVAERVVVLEEQCAELDRRIARWERIAASEGGEAP